MYSRILAPLDGSPMTKRVLEETLRLAKFCKADVKLVFGIEMPSTFGHAFVDVGAFRNGMRAAGRQVLDQAVATARQNGVETTTEILEDDERPVAHSILNACEQWRADVIVMGTHGRHGIDRLLLGSVAQGVIRDAKVPVLVVHE